MNTVQVLQANKYMWHLGSNSTMAGAPSLKGGIKAFGNLFSKPGGKIIQGSLHEGTPSPVPPPLLIWTWFKKILVYKVHTCPGRNNTGHQVYQTMPCRPFSVLHTPT